MPRDDYDRASILDDDGQATIGLDQLAKVGYGGGKSSITIPPRPPMPGVADETKVVSGKAEFTSIGLLLPDNLTLEAWQKLGGNIGKVKTGLQWIIGDWVNAAKKEWGNTYDYAMKVTGMKYDRLANLASVTSRFQFSSRKEKLFFAHHAAVLACPEEKWNEILEYAVAFELSVADLRKEIRASRLDTEQKRLRDQQRTEQRIERRKKVKAVVKVAELVYSRKKLTDDDVNAIQAQLDELAAALRSRVTGERDER